MNIVYGFDDQNIINEIENCLSENGCIFDSHCCSTKMDILYEVMNNDEIDCIVLIENNSGENPWSAYEMARLVDGRDINVVPLLRDIHQDGGEFVKILYASEITSAMFGNVKPSELARQMMSPRSKKEARFYYKIKESTLNVRTVSGIELEKILGYLERSKSDEDLIERFDNACSELTDEQIKDLIPKINSEKQVVLRESITYCSIFGTLKKKQRLKVSTPLKFPTFKEEEKNREIHILYGFRDDDVKDYINDALIEKNYFIRCEKKYSKNGIRDYLEKNDDVDAVVIVEHLESRGKYTSEELSALAKDRNINIIPLLFNSEKGMDYMVELYSAGITSALFGDAAKTDNVVELIINKRTRQQAREYYGISFGCERLILCNKYKQNIYNYLKRGKGDFVSRCKFIKSLLNETQVKEFIVWCPEEMQIKLLNTGIFKKTKIQFTSDVVKKKCSRNTRKNKPKQIILSNDEQESEEIVEVEDPTPIVEKKKREDGLKTINFFLRDFKLKEMVISWRNIRKKKLVLAGGMALLIIAGAVFCARAGSDKLEPETIYGGVNVIVQGVNRTTTISENREENTTFVEVTTVGETEIQTTKAVEVTTQEVTTKRVKKKKNVSKTKKPKKASTVDETTIRRAEKKTTEGMTKENKRKNLGSYSESNILSKSKVDIIRNSLMSVMSGGSNSELTNLARYMANNGLSNASGTYKELTGSSRQLFANKYAVTIESDSEENIITAAQKITNHYRSVGGSKFGVGISSRAGNTGYSITIVVVYE